MSNARYFSGRDGKLWMKSRTLVSTPADEQENPEVQEEEPALTVSDYQKVIKLINKNRPKFRKFSLQ